ncbi:Gfo/Idh/MocA family oxidoreductase [Stieleria sp. TO1_6]|uniref:Gfo/Idh/MocA family protein n=1 Tax=Stieleria tagensis TaxID=2956795 RepID=UPI00209BABE6|nr:Gfo/Idh/MocA family oxidoreductase [Stieleria tagensis]MCO8120616.1 Gfo/Idh/MocA family oxidoreductase [Stieleria tagensis]
MFQSRRTFLARGATGAAATVACSATNLIAAKNDRPTLGLIGAGWQPDTRRQGRGIAIGRQAAELTDVSVICELDSVAAAFANKTVSGGRAKIVDDYRTVLDDQAINAVLIATPDHWHAKIAIEAMRAGKDVYCEKPVAVTIQEGQWLRKVAQETGRVFQVGTQQRSEYDQRFLKAIALVRNGRVGKLNRIQIGLGPGWKGGPFQTEAAPKTLNWERWLGPAPMTEYIKQRTHRTFRWWYEYAGGQLCDWGAHHVDIAQWAIGQENGGPLSVGGAAEMNQPLIAGMPTRSDTYNTPVEFSVKCQFPGEVEMVIDSSRNGITFEGDQGRFFVNRGTLEGKPVDGLQDNPLPENAIEDLYRGKTPTTHMQNFVDSLASRELPISDIATHHRILTTCHLANLSLRLGRTLQWDAQAEQVVGDAEANGLMARRYRRGYEIQNV